MLCSLGGTGSPSILVVDDDRDFRLGIVEVLETELPPGYRVLQAQDPVEAQEIAFDEGARLVEVVSDIDMPNGSGLTLCADLHARYPQIGRFVIMTGDPNQERRRAATKLGARFLPKPFTINDLLQATMH